MAEPVERVRELHKPQERQYPASITHECCGCDQGPYAEGLPGWPCATAEIVYTPGEIDAVRAREAAHDQRV